MSGVPGSTGAGLDSAAVGPSGAAAAVVIRTDSGAARTIPVYDRLFVGRECAGIDDAHRLVVDDPEVSRNHAEIRLDVIHDLAYVVDTSTNGTRVNGARIERAMPVPLRAGDVVSVGRLELLFQSESFRAGPRFDPRKTAFRVTTAEMLMVVGDIVTYSTISQYTDSSVVAHDLEVLYGSVRELLSEHRGTLSDYAGDAMFAVWDKSYLADAEERATNFALAAVDLVNSVAPSLSIRDPDGAPVRMGWAVVAGDAAVSSLTGSLVSVVGDAANLAFRLSGLAARGGRAPVIVTAKVHDAVADRFRFGEPVCVETKGRTGEETIFEVLGRP